MFDLGAVLKEGIDIVKRNYVLAIPAVVASVLIGFMVVLTIGAPQSMEEIEANGVSKTFFIILLVAMSAHFFLHGVTVAMADEALKKGQASLKTAGLAVSTFSYPFITAAALLTVIIIVGLSLLIVPGLVAMFLLMFTFPAIVVHKLGPTEALHRSYLVVRANLNDSLILFAALGAIILGFMLISLMIAAVPIVGQFINIVLNGIVSGFLAVVFMRAYIIFEERQPSATQ